MDEHRNFRSDYDEGRFDAFETVEAHITQGETLREAAMSDERPDKSAFGEDRDAGTPFVIGSADLGVDLSALRNVVKHLGATELEDRAFQVTEPDECDYCQAFRFRDWDTVSRLQEERGGPDKACRCDSWEGNHD